VQTVLAAPFAATFPSESVTDFGTQDEKASEAEDRLIAWEQDRAATLKDASDSEQHGLRLLTRAALLRLHVKFEDEGLFVVAHELRDQADAIQDETPEIGTSAQPLTNAPF
jgi:hypothetical protein